MRAMIVLTLLLVPTAAIAQNKALLIQGGKYYLIDANSGVPVVEELTKVVSLDTDTPTPKPPATDTRSKVKQLTQAVNDPLIASAIAQGAYATVRARDIDWAQAQTILKAATDLAVSQSDNKPGWTVWRTGLGKLIDDAQREGKLTTKAQQSAFLLAIEQGMGDATANAAIDLEKLLSLIRAIIDLIISLMGNQPANPGGVTQVAPPLLLLSPPPLSQILAARTVDL